MPTGTRFTHTSAIRASIWPVSAPVWPLPRESSRWICVVIRRQKAIAAATFWKSLTLTVEFATAPVRLALKSATVEVVGTGR